MTAIQMGKLKTRLGMGGIFCVPRVEENGGFSGGLCFFWRSSISVSFINSSFYFIDVWVKWEVGKECRVTSFYGHPVATQRHTSWDLLRGLKEEVQRPWLCCGDFNEILDVGEKIGGHLKPFWQIKNFRKTVEECGLFQFAFTGFGFTWDNKRVGEANIKERIDRGFGNLLLLQQWGGFTTHHLVTMASDHCPLLIESDSGVSVTGGSNRRHRRFLFEEMWIQDDECGRVIGDGWKDLGNASTVAKLQQVAGDLRCWGREKFGKVRSQVIDLRREIDVFQRAGPSFLNLQRRQEKEMQLDQLLEREEILWSQRARVNWLQYGDRNTKFFHQVAKHRGKINRITGILDEENRWYTGVEDIGVVFVDSLSRPYTRVEIECALKGMGPTKSPGPDGMPALFYQRYWSIVGSDVVATCLDFLNGQGSVEGINETLIALIPKIQDPKKVKEYRPISLCNVIYKLISKVLANRLKKVLTNTVSESQSAFVPSRLIHDNVIAAFETIHCLKRRGKKSRQKAAIKLDMAKAYDRVEWAFLRKMMETFLFPGRFISLIMSCVQTVKYSVLIQGAPFGKIVPTRGLRQGDPISPYLFLLVAEGFSSLVRNAGMNRLIHGVSIARGAPSVSHLFFADDSLFFCDATVSDCSNLKEVFRIYEESSGQKINYEKSAVCFSPRTQEILSKTVGTSFRWLLFPVMNVILAFLRLLERINVPSSGVYLTESGRNQLPLGTCHEINRCLARFWWSNFTGKGIHWRKWDKLCCPKGEGGLGFREIVGFNQALLAKQAWRLLMYPNSLVGRMLKAKYYPRENFLQAGLGAAPSFLWRSVLWGRDLLQVGLRKRIGNGNHTSVYMDQWVPGLDGFRIQPSGSIDLSLRVADLHSDSGGWNVGRLQSLFPIHEVEAILSIPVVHTSVDDSYLWHHNKNGKYSVKSGYWVAMDKRRREVGTARLSADVSQYWRHLWKLKVPPKMNHFLWRCSRGFIPCKEALLKKRIVDNDECFRCSNVRESPLHATWSCVAARAVLEKASFYSKLTPNSFMDFTLFLEDALKKLTVEEAKLLVIILWGNWKERNDVFHGSPATDLGVLFIRAVTLWHGLLEVQSVLGGGVKSNPLGGQSGDEKSWQPPSFPFIKFNCDGAVEGIGKRVGIGVIARNGQGDLLVAVGQNLELRLSAFAAELFAVKLALEVAVERRMALVLIETDCLEAVSMINGEEVCMAAEGVIVDQIRGLMGLLQIPAILYARRDANKAAHVLAQYVARIGGRFQWFEIGLDWLMQVMSNDLLESNSSFRDVRRSPITRDVGEGISTAYRSHVL
ncbi:hypothetical protein M0R45_035213 [Rubus argutus]|uniref:Reverse transcriptase domain-containing protein n=1 Tax=Rubus argutus TaxID=59490 RepID=A0AAW1VUY2_RUBAR